MMQNSIKPFPDLAPDEAQLGRMVRPSLLTVFGLAVLAFVVYQTMAFVTRKLGMEAAYWLVPLFGALGGTAGAVLRGERKLALCRYESPSTIDLGVLGDISLGLGGAATVIFLFGGTLKFDPNKHDTYAILISVSLIAGASGKRILELAVKKLEDIATQKGKEAGEKAAQEKTAVLKEELLTGMAGAMYYTQKAVEKNDQGQPSEGMELAKRAIASAREFVYGYVEKGRALKRMGKLTEALTTIEETFKIEAHNPKLFYNRACYKCLLKRPVSEVMDDLSQAVKLQPKLKEEARTDPDFETIRGLPEFRQLVGEPA